MLFTAVIIITYDSEDKDKANSCEKNVTLEALIMTYQ